jgi:branched-chain amino acid transport system permease protein
VFQVLAAVAAACLASVLMERVVYRPLRGSSFVTLLIASFAVSVIIQNLLRAFVSPRQRGLPLPDYFNEVVTIGPVSLGWLQIMTTLTTFAALGVLVFFLRRSLLGVSMLAAAQDFKTSRLMGIRANRVISTAFAISGALAGIAAVFLVARRGIVDPVMGFNPLLKAFIAVVIGGLGSLPGAVVGGFVLGAIEVALATGLPTEMLPFRDALALTVVILILYVRPDGLVSRPAEAH